MTFTGNCSQSILHTALNLTGVITTIAGKAGTQGSKDGIGTAASLYVTDTGNNTIRKIQ